MCRRLKAGVLICEGFVLYITAVHHNHLPCFKRVFSEDKTPCLLYFIHCCHDFRPEQETWTRTLEGGQCRLLRSLHGSHFSYLFYHWIYQGHVNLEITCWGAGWSHIWVGFDGFVHYNLLADSTFSSRCAQRFYLLSSSCPQQIQLKT